ncbi:DUF4232 domain-containing protein [Streptomyces sp. ITFR-6]|uniref:DUF4232 domain-containing protein n=1 Tax=Streptomyces sp. ITFR-6 TaxID=3075197 RepID=UPI00288B1FD6|nr:DUF4232 domain-containing protein [Streptomyces sp. ITFR-6]WNI33657.1 DUF4232 domain-containing protein [Streptomyces sp. ITFR-6]
MSSLLRTTPSPSEQSLRSREKTTARRAGTRRPRLLAPVAAASIALVTAGCGGTAASAGQPAGSGSATASTPTARQPADPASSPAARQPAAPSSSPSAAAAGAPEAARCTTKGLAMRLGTGDAGAGQIRYRLTFTNKSGHPCALQGFPGVSMIRRDGSVIGVPAEREGAPGKQTVIGAGGTAAVTLHTLNQGIKGSGCWRKPDYLRVYPPGSKEALTLRTSGLRVCGDRFTTTAVEG